MTIQLWLMKGTDYGFLINMTDYADYGYFMNMTNYGDYGHLNQDCGLLWTQFSFC